MKNTKYKLFLLVGKYMPVVIAIGIFINIILAIVYKPYHDYYTLYYEWLDGDEAEVHEKIILSAITFWFKDEDAKEGKVWDYFND